MKLKRHHDLWATEEPSTVRTRTIPTPAPARSSGTTTWTDDPPVQVRITHASGKEEVIMAGEINADNPVIKRLVNIRPIRRFWRLNLTVSNPVYYTDEEIILKADHEGLKTSDPVEAGKAMNFIAEYYLTDGAGEPLKEGGKWVPVDIPTAPPATT